MNPAVEQLYADYLQRTNCDTTAAASLTLAEVMQSAKDVNGAVGTPQQNRPLTVPEVAKFLRVRPDKVLSWIRSGRLRGYNVAERESGRPKYRVNPDDLEAFMQQRAIIQPAPKGRPAGRHRRIPTVPAWPHL
jgi:excisionase family DNA binding protein